MGEDGREEKGCAWIIIAIAALIIAVSVAQQLPRLIELLAK